MPGIIGTSTEKMTANAPITVSFMYAAALAVQKKSGANKSHSPTAVVPHCAHAKRGDRASNPNSISSRPDATSFRPASTLRKLGSHRPRSCVMSRIIPVVAVASNRAYWNGLVRSQAPRVITRKWTQSIFVPHRRHASHVLMHLFFMFVAMLLFGFFAEPRSLSRHFRRV